MSKEKKRAKLYLFKFDKCKSEDRIIETLQAALQFARHNKVSAVDVNMSYENGVISMIGTADIESS